MVKQENRDSVYYFSKGTNRKNSIYDWGRDIYRELGYYEKIKAVNQTGDFTLAYQLFLRALDHIISLNYDQFGYIIEANQDLYGSDNVNIDLFRGIFGKYPVKIGPKEEGVVIEKPKEVEKHKVTGQFFYGINSKTGKRERAELEIDLIKGKYEQFKLRSLKTGRYLKLTKSFKKTIYRGDK